MCGQRGGKARPSAVPSPCALPPRYDILNPRHRPPAAPLVAPHFCPWLYYGGTGTVDEMDHKERVAQGQNGGTKNEEKDGRTPFAGRVGVSLSAVVIEGGHRGPPLQTTYVTRRRGRPPCRPVVGVCTPANPPHPSWLRHATFSPAGRRL